jgi:hypothetical protein
MRWCCYLWENVDSKVWQYVYCAIHWSFWRLNLQNIFLYSIFHFSLSPLNLEFNSQGSSWMICWNLKKNSGFGLEIFLKTWLNCSIGDDNLTRISFDSIFRMYETNEKFGELVQWIFSTFEILTLPKKKDSYPSN